MGRRPSVPRRTRFVAVPATGGYGPSAERRPRDEPARPPAQPPGGAGNIVRTAASAPAPAPAGPPAADRLVPLDLNAAVGYALEHNPALTAVRTQRGVAQAGVVIARQ